MLLEEKTGEIADVSRLERNDNTLDITWGDVVKEVGNDVDEQPINFYYCHIRNVNLWPDHLSVLQHKWQKINKNFRNAMELPVAIRL